MAGREDIEMEHTTTADTLFNEGMISFANNDYPKSIEILTEAADLDEGHKLTFVGRGSAYLQMGQLDQARADFNHAIDLDPGYARAFHLRGLVEEKRGNVEQALLDFTRAIELEPEYGAAYQSRAMLLTNMGREEEAADDVVMIQHLTSKNLAEFAGENNIWQSTHLGVEDAMETELNR
jgi:tetratricopeptide (TPR) repeat protein